METTSSAPIPGSPGKEPVFGSLPHTKVFLWIEINGILKKISEKDVTITTVNDHIIVEGNITEVHNSVLLQKTYSSRRDNSLLEND